MKDEGSGIKLNLPLVVAERNLFMTKQKSDCRDDSVDEALDELA